MSHVFVFVLCISNSIAALCGVSSRASRLVLTSSTVGHNVTDGSVYRRVSYTFLEEETFFTCPFLSPEPLVPLWNLIVSRRVLGMNRKYMFVFFLFGTRMFIYQLIGCAKIVAGPLVASDDWLLGGRCLYLTDTRVKQTVLINAEASVGSEDMKRNGRVIHTSCSLQGV